MGTRNIKNAPPLGETFLVEEGGFEPPKRIATDLQSAPFGHSGTPPYELDGAGGRTRTPDRLITNQLLYQLSYTSRPARPQRMLFYQGEGDLSSGLQKFFKKFWRRSGYPATGMDRPAAGRAAGAAGRMVPPLRRGVVWRGAGGMPVLPGGAKRQREGDVE